MKASKKIQPLLSSRSRLNYGVAGLICVALVVTGYIIVKIFAATGAATLSLSPSQSFMANGSTFTVNIMEDSGSAQVNAVQANLTYPTSQLQLVSISSTGSGFPTVAQQSGSNGSITIAQATTGGAPPNTGSQLVATLTFTSLMSTGQAAVSFAAGSAVVSSVDNTALPLTTTGGTYGPDTTAPSVPAGLHVTGTTGSSVSLAWTASTDNVGVTGYNVYSGGAKIATVSGTTYTNTGLTQGSSHTYTVTAFDAAGNESVQSPGVTQVVPDVTAPSVPAGLAATAPAYNKVTLTWNASTDTGGSGLAGYHLYRNGSTTALASVAAGTQTYSDTTVSGSTTYSYTIAAYDGSNNQSAKSTAVSVTTPAPPDTTPPSIPTSLQATSVNLTSVTLTWAASTDNVAVAGYQVFRNGTLVGSPSTATFTDSNGVTYNTTYQYSVKAIDTSGNLSTAATLSVTTLPLKSGDLNLDNQVNIFDLSILLNQWNQAGASLSGDLNHDGAVNIFDLSIMLSKWGS